VTTDESGTTGVGGLEAAVFLAELVMLAALVGVGIALPSSTVAKVVAAVALPAVAIAVWGRWLAPRAPRRLPHRSGLVAKVAIFAVTALLLALAGPVWVAVVFLVVTEAVVVAAERRRGPAR
jgi:hypothetical protein